MSNKNSEEFWNNTISLNRKSNGNTFLSSPDLTQLSNNLKTSIFTYPYIFKQHEYIQHMHILHKPFIKSSTSFPNLSSFRHVAETIFYYIPIHVFH